MGLFSKEKLWMKLLNRQLIAEALEEMKAELAKKLDDMERHGILYAYANALYTYTGQGPAARDAFRDLLDLQNDLCDRGRLPYQSEFVMWTIHNSAPLSSSYEEYFEYIDMLKERFPNAPILASQVFDTASRREAGIPWNEVRMSIALSLGQGSGMKRPTTMHSCMACFYSVILKDSTNVPKSGNELVFLSDIASMYSESIAALAREFGMMGYAAAMQPTVEFVCNSAVNLLKDFSYYQPSATSISDCMDNVERARNGLSIQPRYDANKFDSQSRLIDLLSDKTGKSLYLDVANGYEKAEAEVTEPILRILLAHNHSIFYWTYIGQGSIALELMEKEWQLWESLHIPAEHIPAARVMAGQTAENAMLICPNIETFVKWRDRLDSVTPKAKIIEEIGRTFEEKYENGCAWWDCMSQIAMSMYNRNDPSLDSGRYGNAAASWQMVLENRKKLHLPAEGWKVAAMEYGILTLRLVAQNARRLGSSYNASQGAMPVRIARPFIEEYVAAHPGDEVETAILRDIRMVLSEAGAI